MALYGFSCSNSGGGSKAETRDFYIKDYQINNVWYYCYAYLEPVPDHPHDSGSASTGGYFEESAAEFTDELPELNRGMYIIQPGRGYSLKVEYFNDQEETNPVKWIAFEVFVAGERYTSSGHIVVFDKRVKENTAQILLFNPVPWYFEGKEVIIEVWVEDESGVKSEVLPIEVSVVSLWYRPLQ